MADQSFITDILAPITGEKPQVADWTNIKLSNAQLESLLGNMKNWDQMIRLSNLYNTYVKQQYPWFQSLLDKGVSTAGQMFDTASGWLKGEVDPATEAATRRAAAQQNIGSGLFEGSAGKANVARNLGLLPSQFIEKGAALAGAGTNAAQAWTRMASGMYLDPKQFFISPQEEFTAEYANQMQKQRVQQMKYNIDAAPDPGWRFLSDLVAYETGQYLGSMGGGGMGGMGGGKGGGGGAGGLNMGTNFQNFGLDSSGNAYDFQMPQGTTENNDWFNWGS